MTRYVQLSADRNRTWPWPKTDFRRVCEVAYGEGGFCVRCCRNLTGAPRHLVLVASSKPVKGVWVPNYWHDSWCVDRDTFTSFPFAQEFDTTVVQWRGGGDGGDAVQLVIPVHPEPMFDPAELERRALAAHGRSGATCSECGAWRWLPLGFESVLPDPVIRVTGDTPPPALASQEIFGDGGQTLRQVFFREDVAAALQAAQKGVTPSGVAFGN